MTHTETKPCQCRTTKPSAVIEVDDVNDPHCIVCGREIFPYENIAPPTVSVEDIIESVFLHSKLTPDKSMQLPKGQLTIVEAVDQIKNLVALAKQQDKSHLRSEIEELKQDDRPEITEWLSSKAETKAYNTAISDVLALLTKEL